MKISNTSKVAIVLLAIGFAYMLACGFGVTKTFWGWDASQAGILWKVVMLVPVVICALIIYSFVTQRPIPFTKKVISDLPHMLMLVLLVFGFAASTGFKFTSGHIGERVTPFDDYGKIVNKEVLLEYYSEFYNLAEDTALLHYIDRYQELPGRNNHNAHILAGDHPRSTAPRADEDFKWHGAEDNKIYKRGSR